MDNGGGYACVRVLLNPGPAVLRSEANSRETSVGRKAKDALFWRLATGGGVGGQMPVQRPTSPAPRQSGSKSFYRQREGATGRNNTVSSDSHLEIGHRWSDQRHLDCFRYS